MLGYAFMGKAHSNAFKKIPYITWPPPLEPRLVGIAGRDKEAVGEAAKRYGYEYATTDWRELIADDRIGLFDNGGPNSLHAEPTIAAARGGQARRLREAARPRRGRELRDLEGGRRDGRQAPVRVQLPLRAGGPARTRDGRRRRAGGDPALPRALPAGLGGRPVARHVALLGPDDAGSGALGDIGTHVIDLARFLNGEITTVSGFVKTFVEGRKVDDAMEAAVEFENGSVGTIEGTRLALGRRNALQWEINGSKGSLAFDMERLNELQVFRADGDRARGFKTVLVSEADHPFWEYWWPPGHIIGWGDTFVHELHHMLQAIAADGDVAPYGATFEDGYAPPRSATRSCAPARPAGASRSRTARSRVVEHEGRLAAAVGRRRPRSGRAGRAGRRMPRAHPPSGRARGRGRRRPTSQSCGVAR